MRNSYYIGGLPVLTGATAERFEAICDYNAENLVGAEYSAERERWVKSILEKRKRV